MAERFLAVAEPPPDRSWGLPAAKFLAETGLKRLPPVAQKQRAVLPVEPLLPALGEDVFPVK